MESRISISGPAAEVRWGYHLAATLRDWAIEYGVLTATVVDVDLFRIKQSGLTLVIHYGAPERPTRRPLEDVQIADGALAARLGPRE